MKLNLSSLPIYALALTVAFTSCKKEAEKQTEDNTTEVKAHAEDQNRVSGDLDEMANDANIALESNPSFTGRLSNVNSIICNATTVPDTTSGIWKITITYNGDNCAGTHHRTGTVVLSTPAGTKWKNAGAAITVTFQNLKIKRLSDNKTITINGAQTLTNVSGGLLLFNPNQQTIIHTITSSNMSITFDDNTQRTWNIGRKRTFTYSNNQLVASITGIGVTGGISNAAEWGSNRFGHTFITSITQPLVFRQDCLGRLTSGEIKHQGFATSTVTFGLNASGAPTTCPAGVYYYKLVWTGPNGGSVSAILPY